MNDTHVSTHDAAQDNRNDDIRIYVNGEIVHRDEAKVSVYDSGFMLADGIWEGLRLYDGHIPFLAEHLDRLYEAALYIDLDIGKTRDELIQAIHDTLAANDMTTDVHIRMMITRGKKKKPFQHPHLSIYGPTIVIIAEHSKPDDSVIERGIRLASVPHHRGLPLTQDAKLNSHSKLNCIIPLTHAVRQGADEALMLDPFGFVNTTNACNFFIVRKGEVWTSTGDYCMNGITRQKVIDLCHANDIPVFERNYSLVDTYGADEAFLTGTFGAQTPVFEIDGRLIGGGEAGPVFHRIRALYKAELARSSSVNKPASDLCPIEDRTLRAQVRRQILDQVLAGRFSPGERLIETRLSSRLQVSRAPLREALRELADQGILVSEPYKGFRVRPVSERDLRELYAMRTALEKFAFTVAWPLRTQDNLVELDARCDRLMSVRTTGDQARAIEYEVTFHAWVYETANNRLLLEHWARLSDLVRIYMSLHHNMHGSHGEFGDMTARYRDLCHGRDLDAMHTHIDEHMIQGLGAVLEALS